MDMKHLRYVIAVAEAGSFSAGAKLAFVTQPTLSAAVGALEAELGVRLFERLPRGVQLTREGSRVLAHARVALAEVAAIRAAGKSGAPVGRRLRVGLLTTLPHDLAAATMGRLSQLLAGRRWQTEDAELNSARQRLIRGRLDIIITSLERDPAPGLCQHVLSTDHQVLAVATGTPMPRKITPSILHGKPLIVRTHCEHLQAASRILDEHRVVPLVVAKTDSDARALAMVSAGLGACLVPSSMRGEGVTLVAVEGVKLQRRLGLEWVKGAADGVMDEAVRALQHGGVAA